VIHRHRWTVVSIEKLPSIFEVFEPRGVHLESERATVMDLAQIVRVPVIVRYRCAKCGTEKVRRA
jgi:hypothetical protein